MRGALEKETPCERGSEAARQAQAIRTGNPTALPPTSASTYLGNANTTQLTTPGTLAMLCSFLPDLKNHATRGLLQQQDELLAPILAAFAL